MGGEPYTVIVSSEAINSNGLTEVIVPNHIVTTAGDGKLGVASQINGGTMSAAVIITVDVAPPSITSDTNAPAVDENSGAGQVIYTATATDTTPVTFQLKAGEGNDDALTIDSLTGAVRLTGNPDFEAQALYSFTLIATDAAGNTSEQGVSVNINDLDDNAPLITSSSDAPAITENSGENQIIYTVTATDDNPVTYQLKAGEGDASALSIDQNTGIVRLIDNPDFETQTSYQFTMIATDTAGNASEQTVSINITDQDELAPVITSATVAAAIDENSGAGQVVYTATATDTSDNVTYSLSGDEADLFSIDSQTGAVTLIANPNHETKDSYSVGIIAEDGAGNQSHQAVTLTINDLDDSSPVIHSGDIATTVAENSGAGQVIYTAAASDTADSDDVTDTTGELVYSLKSSGDASAFSIDSSTGAVALIGNPNYEAQSSYQFYVIATDAAGNQDTQGVTLNITDLDESAPTITSAATATAINESSGAGQVIYTATSTDTSAVTYSLGGTDAGLFSINGNTGAVTLTGDPDFETKANYNFSVIATDTVGNNSSKAVSLAINDVPEVDTTIVIFDFISGSSSDHSARTFDGSTTYTIYIRVDENGYNGSLNTTPQGSGSWGKWSGAANLGADDRIILATNGGILSGPKEGSFVGTVFVANNSIVYKTTLSGTTASLAFTLQDNGFLKRRYLGPNSSSVDIFNDAVSNLHLDNATANQLYMTSLPAGIITSQGFV